jgi:hypothetical protein
MEDVDVLVVRRRFISVGAGPAEFGYANNNHALCRVTLKNGEAWAIDTTGAQYGYPETLCPWPEYKQQRTETVGRAREFGSIHAHHHSITSKKIPGVIEMLDLSRMLTELIPLWTRLHGGTLNAILRGSDAVFKGASDKFLDLFDKHLKVCMIRLYSPENVSRRAKEDESGLQTLLADMARVKAGDHSKEAFSRVLEPMRKMGLDPEAFADMFSVICDAVGGPKGK